MALLIIFFIILELFVLITKSRNSYTWMFVTMIMLIEIELIFTLLLYVKLYDYSELYEWERPFHFFLSGIKVNYYKIFDVFTCALTGYMAMSLIVSIHGMKKGVITRIAIIILGIPIIVFAVINSHYINMFFYIKMFTTMQGFYVNISHLINAYIKIVEFC